VEFSLKTTVTALRPGGLLSLATPEGQMELRARRVLIATGARETPRSARLVPGQRAWGVMNTGALQAMVYLKNLVPFRRPLVVGTELVSFSALLTCRRAGIRPVAMIEPNARPTVRWPLHYAHALFGVPLRLNTQIVDIRGDERVRAVRLRDGRGGEEDIACDGVLFTGRFTPESSLARASHLEIDPGSGGPSVDQFGRCSDPLCFASGNLLRPVEVSFRCWREGIEAARRIWRDLDEGLPAPDTGCVRVHARPPLRYVLPQRLVAAHDDSAMKDFQLRVDRPVKGRLRISGGDGAVLYERAMSAIPEQRILAPIPPLEALRGETEIVIDIV
jgi:pyruvate/2-oxoglutarate dehydrogenase complex dihydrolipoamide dehydrogenase (E3) component